MRGRPPIYTEDIRDYLERYSPTRAQDIRVITGASRDTVNRTLNTFIQRGCVKVIGKRSRARLYQWIPEKPRSVAALWPVMGKN